MKQKLTRPHQLPFYRCVQCPCLCTWNCSALRAPSRGAPAASRTPGAAAAACPAGSKLPETSSFPACPWAQFAMEQSQCPPLSQPCHAGVTPPSPATMRLCCNSLTELRSCARQTLVPCRLWGQAQTSPSHSGQNKVFMSASNLKQVLAPGRGHSLPHHLL